MRIASQQFIRNLYLLNDKQPSDIFSRHLPAPRAEVFAGGVTMPLIFECGHAEVLKTIKKGEEKLPFIECEIIKLQRIFRAEKRKKENLKRLPWLYQEQLPFFLYGERNREPTEEDAVKLLREANTPYRPGCESELAKRIMKAAKKVILFNTVKHLTSASALKSIFDDGLLGRRSILELYKDFKCASLFQTDVKLGDANVVCLGANQIDPQARHGIELTFDAKELSRDNPCVFYKQIDLGYDPGQKRTVKIGDLNLRFSHTGRYRCQERNVSSLVLFGQFDNEIAWSDVISSLLIASNLPEMH